MINEIEGNFDLSELVIITNEFYTILIPESFSKELKDKITASIVSSFFGIKSVDYTLKNYVQKEDENDATTESEISKLNDKIIGELKIRIHKIFEKHKTIEFYEESVSSLASDTSLTRTENSYQIVLFLIRLGYYFEANTIIRQIFEQFSYVINICDLSDEEYREIRKSKRRTEKELSVTNINKLKNLIIDIKIGRFYSRLSKMAHIDIKEVQKIVEYDHDIERVMVINRSRSLTLISAQMVYILCYIHEIVLEYAFKKYLTEFEFIKKNENKWSSVPNKNYSEEISNLMKSIKKINKK